MAVEARAYVANVGKQVWAGGVPVGTVKLNASNKGEANKKWAAATPSLSIDMQTLNPEALAWFDARIGKDVKILITDVEDE